SPGPFTVPVSESDETYFVDIILLCFGLRSLYFVRVNEGSDVLQACKDQRSKTQDQSISASYHSIVLRNPSSSEVCARKPNFYNARVTSSERRGCPSGLSVRHLISPLNSVSRAII